MSFQLSKLLVLQGLARVGRESMDCRQPNTQPSGFTASLATTCEDCLF